MFISLQAKYDARQLQTKQTLLPFSQNSWQAKSGYTVLPQQNGILLNGSSYAKPTNGSLVKESRNNNNFFIYNTTTSNSNLLFV